MEHVHIMFLNISWLLVLFFVSIKQVNADKLLFAPSAKFNKYQLFLLSVKNY